MHYLKIRYFFAMLLFAFSLSKGASNAIAKNSTEVSDPIEKANRAVFSFNNFMDKILIKPIAKGYRFVVPELARKGIRNVLTNLSEPVTLINSALQGDAENSFKTFWRFTINSTFGIGGVFDVAKDAGLRHRREDFGQTLGVYGAGDGAYLMLPILGPSNVRDAFGRVVDVFSDPFNYILQDEALITKTAFSGLNARDVTLDITDHIERTSLDPYAAIRSLYTQRRDDAISNGK